MQVLKTGIVKFEGLVTAISPSLTLEVFLHSDLHTVATKEQIGAFPRFRLQQQECGGAKFNVELMFNDKHMVFLVNISKVVRQDDSWKTWSEQIEMDKKKEYDALLHKWLGNQPYNYTWGEVTSDYDARSGSSMITVRYF